MMTLGCIKYVQNLVGVVGWTYVQSVKYLVKMLWIIEQNVIYKIKSACYNVLILWQLPKDCGELGEIFTTEYMQELRNDTNIYYGQKEIDVDNVVFLTGEKDYWTPFAITEDINDNSPAYTIKSRLQTW